MKIQVFAKPSAKANTIRQIGDNQFRISVTEPAENDRANQAVLRLLAEHLNVSCGSLSILKGHQSRQKWVGISKK